MSRATVIGRRNTYLWCNFCNEAGHEDESCQKKKAAGKKCHNCGKKGHVAKECTKGRSTQKCKRCDKQGHVIQECPETTPSAQFYVCLKCHLRGHLQAQCPEWAREAERRSRKKTEQQRKDQWSKKMQRGKRDPTPEF